MNNFCERTFSKFINLKAKNIFEPNINNNLTFVHMNNIFTN